MKRLNELYDCEYDTLVKGIKINSKDVVEGDLFICIMGVSCDRHDFVYDAVKNGASCIVASKKIDVDVPVIMVKDTNKELPLLAARFYDHPEKELKIYSVTGTDGKTSVATITQYLLGDSYCGYIGTNGRKCHAFKKETNNTTPDSDKLYEYFREFVDNGCKCVMMESSSEAFFRGRLDTISYDIGAITNVTREHLNIHGTFENYLDCKCEQFRKIKKDGYAILNRDDEFFSVVKGCSNTNNILTYGMEDDCTLKIAKYEILPNKTNITYRYDNKNYEIESPLLGLFNVYNLACAILISIASGKTFEEIIPNISKIKVDGRLEILPYYGQDFTVMIDYAHTPNGIKNLLDFVHTLDVNRSIVVIGSAGERDFLKRPVMGKTVTDNASYAIFTYEDPRSEDPEAIINMMTKDIIDKSKYEVVVDRSKAIKRAINIACKNDIVLILGKGCETYEKLKNGTIFFSDVDEAVRALKDRFKVKV